jgi:hypothetical protein
MRKPTAILGAVALAAIMPATPALAEGSIIVNDTVCGGFVPTPSGGVGTLLTTEDSHQVQKGEWVTVTCHFDIPAGFEPTKGTKAVGIPCTIPPYGTTYDTRMSASPGGRAVGTCRIRN